MNSSITIIIRPAINGIRCRDVIYRHRSETNGNNNIIITNDVGCFESVLRTENDCSRSVNNDNSRVTNVREYFALVSRFEISEELYKKCLIVFVG